MNHPHPHTDEYWADNDAQYAADSAAAPVWYYDGENTHGVAGLACASTEADANTVGVGPDYEFTGTAQQMVDHLLAEGYNDLDTDSPELRRAWEAATLRHIPTGLIRVGDVVRAHGMRVHIDTIRPYHAPGSGCLDRTDGSCDLAWSCPGTVLNLAEVRAAGIMPRSFLYDEARHSGGPGHGREDSWNVQGNNLATWTVEA